MDWSPDPIVEIVTLFPCNVTLDASWRGFGSVPLDRLPASRRIVIVALDSQGIMKAPIAARATANKIIFFMFCLL